MKSLALILCVILSGKHLQAQRPNSFRVKAGEKIQETHAKEIYRYPSFVEGMVSFKDGMTSNAKLNFNFLTGEMQFMDKNGDTLSVANEHTIKYIAIGTDTFYFDKGFYELINTNQSVKLAKKRSLRIIDRQKIGAFNQASPASSINTYQSFSDGFRTRALDVREDVVLSIETIYFLGDRFNHFFRANKKNVLSMFGKHQEEIANFIRTHATDFNKEQDMDNLISFIGSLK